MIEPAQCKQCKAPLSDVCPCDCDVTINCHVCRAMYSVIYLSAYFTRVQREAEKEERERKDRMGL